jgi:hypothetical protein
VGEGRAQDEGECRGFVTRRYDDRHGRARFGGPYGVETEGTGDVVARLIGICHDVEARHRDGALDTGVDFDETREVIKSD